MNIKIYTSNAEYDIKSYIVNEATVEKCKNGSMNAPEGNTYGTINQYIAGGKKENGERKKKDKSYVGLYGIEKAMEVAVDDPLLQFLWPKIFLDAWHWGQSKSSNNCR